MLRIFLCTFIFSLLYNTCYAAIWDNIVEVRTDYGVKALLVENHNNSIVDMVFTFVGAGYAYEQEDNRGLVKSISVLFNEMKVAKDPQAMSESLQAKGISLSFSYDVDNFYVHVRTISKNLNFAMESLIQLLSNPVFREEDLEMVDKKREAAILYNKSDPDVVSWDKMLEFVYKNHPYSRNSHGNNSKNILVSDLTSYVKQRFNRLALRVSAIGDITRYELENILSDVYFMDLSLTSVKKGEISPVDVYTSTKEYYVHMDVSQSVIRFVQPGIKFGIRDYYVGIVLLEAMTGAMGSMLLTELRDKRGYVYYAVGSIYNMQYSNIFLGKTATDSKNVPEVLEILRSVWKRAQNGEIEKDVFNNAKKRLLSSLQLQFDTNAGFLKLISNISSFDDNSIESVSKYVNNITSVTYEEVLELANRWLDPEKLVVVIVGNNQNGQ